jgi:hypothetical protein
MGLCRSKVAPETNYYELLRNYANIIRRQNAFYTQILSNGTFDRQIFLEHNNMEESIHRIRDEFMAILSEKTVKKESHSTELMKEYNALRFEYMNNLLFFKRHMYERLLDNHFIVDDKLLKSASFRKFFTILPDAESSKSFYDHVSKDKQKRDSISLHKQITEGGGIYEMKPTSRYNTCQHCGTDLTIASNPIRKSIDATHEMPRPVSVSSSISRAHSEAKEESVTPETHHTKPPHAKQHVPLRISVSRKNDTIFL